MRVAAPPEGGGGAGGASVSAVTGAASVDAGMSGGVPGVAPATSAAAAAAVPPPVGTSAEAGTDDARAGVAAAWPPEWKSSASCRVHSSISSRSRSEQATLCGTSRLFRTAHSAMFRYADRLPDARDSDDILYSRANEEAAALNSSRIRAAASLPTRSSRVPATPPPPVPPPPPSMVVRGGGTGAPTARPVASAKRGAAPLAPVHTVGWPWRQPRGGGGAGDAGNDTSSGGRGGDTASQRWRRRHRQRRRQKQQQRQRRRQ